MIINGKHIALAIEEEISKELREHNLNRSPCLAMILVGSNPSSQAYVSSKSKACLRVGIQTLDIKFNDSISENELLEKIQELNQARDVDGILVQLPLPSHINESKIVEAILPEKDIDGFHPQNLGKLILGMENGFIPCTPKGIKLLLDYSQISVEGKHVVIVGRSHIVGKPLALLLLQKKHTFNATVTVAHSKTKNLQALTLSADILVCAMGSPLFVTKDMISEGTVIIDVGNNRIEDPHLSKGYKFVGDVDFENVATKCKAITPVPGGVGPMTVVSLLLNTLQSFKNRNN